MRLAPTLVVLFCVTNAALLSTTVYLHRALAHKAISLHAAPAMVFRVILWGTTGIVPRAWVAVHRKHHAFSDEPQDPHSPVQLGFWAVQLGNVKLYRACIRDGSTVNKYSRDLPPDRLDKAVFDRPLVGLTIGITLLVLILGVPGTLLVIAAHSVLYLGINAAVNAVGHTFGKRPYQNQATNNQWLAWISCGEGLHNNHHAAPTSARFALAKGDKDPGWWLIRLLVRSRLAQIRLDEVKLKQTA